MSDNGVVTIKSNHSADETASRLESILIDKGMKIVARVNHSAAAESVGESLAHSEVFIFGNPKAGTPLMQNSPTMALDLPQKMLVWQDADETVYLSFNDADYLAVRHQLDACAEPVAKTAGALHAIATAAAGIQS